ncbi:MAG: thioredoxin family protein, partial [Chlamydiia bacterium]|nr:thioredoxin family protein [Chlamydiia bacterium]
TTQQFDVTSVPTLVLFKNGQEIERVIGLKDKGSLQGMLEAAL